MGKIQQIEYFRVPPRWLFVKITDEKGNVGWGEASLEGHTQAVEGCLDAWIERYTGLEAEYMTEYMVCPPSRLTKLVVISSTSGNYRGELDFTGVVRSS